MKHIIRAASFVLVILMFASATACVEIDDVYSSDTKDITTERYESYGGDETYLVESNKADTVVSNTCVINVFNSTGHSTNIARPSVDQEKELREILETGEYDASYKETSQDQSYIRVLFEDNASKEAYIIYPDDVVVYRYSDSIITKGKNEGLYRGVRSIMTEAQREKSEAESAAGYSFDSLIVCSDKEFDLSELSYLDCMGITHLMYDEKGGTTWWVFYFDTDTKSEINNVFKELGKLDDVMSVEYNYIFTIE